MRKIHFFESEILSHMTECGRSIYDNRRTRLETSADLDAVTCGSCKKSYRFTRAMWRRRGWGDD